MRALGIKNFLGYYITDTGVVYSRNNKLGRFCKMHPPKTRVGYFQVGLTKKHKRYFFGVHRLVAESFLPNPQNKPCINHKNGIRHDNRIENLEWVTYSENMKHAYAVLKHKHSGVCA